MPEGPEYDTAVLKTRLDYVEKQVTSIASDLKRTFWLLIGTLIASLGQIAVVGFTHGLGF